ncbi:MAG: histidine--tRNA ligase [Bacteroidales bacterium]|jgi:histidyl-tRNA synthetase|nr:histidine--tRNA ligase [Bacteroidales bacterium]
MQKPSIPKGTRDFTPVETVRRNYIFDTIKAIFQKFGFQPIETPAMENLSTLLGKYGEEGDKLLFRILNSGDFLSDVSDLDWAEKNPNRLSPKMCGKGLRYDLTVPFARFVVQRQSEICFPFKRYQIQPVWRADRPQKGRYREFYQCDVDVVGSNSLLNEAELLQIIAEVFRALNIRVTVKLNNRKILSGIAELIGQSDKITDITVAIDKLEKIGIEKVNGELLSKGLSMEAVEALQPVILLSGPNDEKLDKLDGLFACSATGREGVVEMRAILAYADTLKILVPIELDLTLARGLNYYTGAIFEVKAADVQIGSICGGGRYDNLTGIFGLPDVSGVGISFGADRIYDVLARLDAFPAGIVQTTKLLFINFGPTGEMHVLQLLAKAREAGIHAEMYPEAAKMKKQMAYANSKSVAYVAMVGENEMANNHISLKNMATGEQTTVTLEEMIRQLTSGNGL